jgi:hypothetical protein
MKWLLGSVVAGIGLLLAGTAGAVSIALPDFTSAITITNSNGVTWYDNALDLGTISNEVTPNGTAFDYSGDLTAPKWALGWDMTVDQDPLISGSFSITNSTSLTQTFDVTFGLPVASAFSPAVKTGSVGFSFADTNNSGGASVNLTTWEGLIDGSNAMSLFTSSIPCLGTGCTGAIATISDGPNSHPAGVNSTIGIHLVFALSAGDTVNFNTSFEVNPVPVPAAVWLFGSGLLGLFGVARKQQWTA